jgi:hypothetical protein
MEPKPIDFELNTALKSLTTRAQAFIDKYTTEHTWNTTAELMAAFAVEMRVERSMNALAKKLRDFLTSCDSCGAEADNILCDNCLAKMNVPKAYNYTANVVSKNQTGNVWMIKRWMGPTKPPDDCQETEITLPVEMVDVPKVLEAAIKRNSWG